MSVHILLALSNFETKNFGKQPSLRHFAVRKPWMISYSFLLKLILQLFILTKPPIPGLFLKHMVGLIINRLKTNSIYKDLASAADGIQLKHDYTRLRAFYFPSENNDGCCLKIVSNKHDIAERAKNELKVRKTLAESGSITVPKIIKVEEDDEFIYILEE